jgi:hypothetical protein
MLASFVLEVSFSLIFLSYLIFKNETSNPLKSQQKE